MAPRSGASEMPRLRSVPLRPIVGAKGALAIERTERLRRRIAEELLQAVESARAGGETRQRVGERLHPEVLRAVGRIGSIEAIQERGHFEQARAVLDEVLVDNFFRTQW